MLFYLGKNSAINKVSDNTKDTTAFVLRATTDGFINSSIYTIDIKANDFKLPNVYQDFSIEIVKPPTGWLQFPVGWSGETNVWVDCIKVIEEKVFTDEDMENFWK